MSSWFSMDALAELKESATSAATAATTAAQAVLTDETAREGLIKKLTLNTDELKSEREQMEVEETRKAEVKDDLARLLPWETLDEEREILCEECRENILKMSTDTSTFTGPFSLPGQSNTEVAATDKDEEDEVEADDGQDGGSEVSASDGGEEEGGDNDISTGDHDKQTGEGGDGDQDASAATESETSTRPDLSDKAVEAAKLEAKRAKLDPLPPLLQNFDLDAHVGLIQRLFDVDPNLVEMHADLGGAGAREMAFWRNYFFHCALARYEAGLSVDEIWGEKPAKGLMQAAAADGGAAAAAEETTVTFEPASPTGQMNGTLDDTSASHSAPSSGGAPATAPTLTGPESSRLSTVSDYEMIAAGVGGAGSGVGGGDAGGGADESEDMDDLEAEIARELEGLEDDE